MTHQLTHQLPAPGWEARAACAGLVTSPADDLFFAASHFTPGESAVVTVQRHYAQEQQAKQVCARCPVTRECLAYALATGQQYGVWGGLGEREVRAMATAHRSNTTARRRAAAGGGG